jgi:glycine cleavage system H protein
MSNVPEELKYTSEHEWIRIEKDGTLVVGITDHAQHQLGELVYVELPDAGRELGAGDSCAVVESVKAASDVYSPVAGTVIGSNEALNQEPALVNSSPYDAGWLFRVKPSGGIEELLDAAEYRRLVEAES